MSLHFGVHLPIHGRYRYRDVLKVSVVADRLGFYSLWVGDHFYLPEEYYARSGGDSTKPDTLDAWTVLAALACQTEKVRLGTRVSPIPFYTPARLAKVVTTVDIISEGRVDFGVGAGWFKEEAISYGVWWGDHRERISRMLEGLEIILKLWTEDRTTYKGKHYEVYNAPFWPKPVQKPHPPIWFGGVSDQILEATVKYGVGLLPPSDISAEEFKKLAGRMTRIAESSGGKRISSVASISYPEGLGGEPSEWLSTIEEYIEAGADGILIDFSRVGTPSDEAVSVLKKFSGQVFPRLLP